ncbi:MAG TPA: HlyD family efflux transporter periplasmic adaptor subunit [Vicinamibacterales bacterium]|nr:HlyD family efflux transporter periplasmic adaptor subunit [Vicinamibacterales bacterium]
MKKIRRAIIGGLAIIAVIVISVAVARLKPAAPGVSATTLWFGTVKRGPMVREVHGAGVLTPEDIRWIPATTSGRVENIILRPGAIVKPGTVILELSNPDLKSQATNAELAWKSAEAQLVNLRVTLSQNKLALQAAVTDAESQLKVSVADLEANKQLAAQGLVADLTVKQKQATVDQGQNRLDVAKKNLESALANEQSQLAPQEAQVNQQKANYELYQRQLGDLQVKSTMDGVLQVIPVEVGQQVGPGANLARVADPKRLKAEVRISETQTKDLAIGQEADIDTRNGHVKGHVVRIDPSSTNGTVGVDVTLDEALPPGARPDLSVDGVIELQRLENILYVERPAFGQENQTVGLFKLVPTGGPIMAGQEVGHEAVQTSVKLGRASVQFIEVLEGLQEGDRVVLSDMSQYDTYNRIKLN